MDGTTLPDAENCPKCNASLVGEPIPDEWLHCYNHGPNGELIATAEEYAAVRDQIQNETTHFGRVIGLYSWEQDRTVAWCCPDCGYEEERI